MIAVITPTRNRLFALSLLHKYLVRQSRLPDLWIIATDGDVPEIPIDIPHVIASSKYAGSPLQSFAGNLDKGIEVAKSHNVDGVLVMEDDDWYAPQYIQEMEKLFKEGQLIGINKARYFHVHEGYDPSCEQLSNVSLARMGVARSQFELFQEVIRERAAENDFRIDIALFQKAQQNGIPTMTIEEPALHLGLKGMYNLGSSKGLTNRHKGLNRTFGGRISRLISPTKRRREQTARHVFDQLCGMIGAEDAAAYRDIIWGAAPIE